MKKLLGIVLLFLVDSTNAEEQTHAKRMAGWSVSADSRVEKEQLNTLEATLKEINSLVPPRMLPGLQRVPIHVEGEDHSKKTGTFMTGVYEAPGTLVVNGVAKPNGVGRIRIASSRDCGNKILLVHELSHAAQALTIGSDNMQVKKAYQEVVAKKLYPMPPAKDSYLMTSHSEYFAEMSVVYLMKLHYFPHDRETLKKHDPISYKLMEKFWGKPPGKQQK